MRPDTRLSRVLHVLLHLSELNAPVTSSVIAQMLGTNGAVVRRMMAGLRDAGLVTSVKGHGGGWSLARPLDEISLLTVYQAIGSPTLFAMGNDEERPRCLLARAANDAADEALAVARHSFEAVLERASVSDLAAKRAREMR